MPTNLARVELTGAGKIIQPVLLRIGTTIPSLVGCTVSAGIYHVGAEPGDEPELVETLTEADGIEILDRTPEPAASGESQDPHLNMILAADLVSDLPHGMKAFAAFEVLVAANGSVVSWEPLYLHRLR